MRERKSHRWIRMHPRLAGFVFVALMVITFLIFFTFTIRIPQWSSYHHFADGRSIWGIPNFWNVVSNIPFLLVSMLGFISLRKHWNKHQVTKEEFIVFFTLFFGIFLTSIGSSYYHWSPDNARLVWDRIPMTIVFMSLLSLTIMERINARLGFGLFIPLLMLGVFSVLYWYWTELAEHGDLRTYGIVQFYSMFLILCVLFFFPKTYPPLQAYLWMFVFYILAKVFECYDLTIHNLLDGQISGHTLKHLAAAISAYFTVVILNSKPEITYEAP